MKLFGSKKSKSKNKSNNKNRNKDQNQNQTASPASTTPTKAEDAKYVFKGKDIVTTPNAEEGSKRSKKRFSLFKSRKSKKSSNRNSADENVVTTTTTPSTVRGDFNDHHQQQQQQHQEDYSGDYPDHFVTVIPVGGEVGNNNNNNNNNNNESATAATAATRIMETNTETIKKNEEELQETLSWARNLLQELDMAEVDPNDEDAEGTELVLPGTVYENVNNDTIAEENNDDDVDEQVMVHTYRNLQQKITIGNNIQITNDNNNNNNDGNEALNATEEKKYDNNDSDDLRKKSILNDDEGEKNDGDDEIQEKTDSQPTDSSFLNTSNNSNNISNISCTSTILSAAFNCTQEDAENCATLPENIGGIMPTACQPIINKHTSLYKQNKRDNENNKLIDGRRSNNPNDYYLNDSSFDAKFASEFLHGMLNVGYTLIYHKSIDDEYWVGRTVNLIYRPGICSTRTITQPVIEWKTMIGGKSTVVETRTMKLLNIDAISTSNASGAEKRSTPTSNDESPNPSSGNVIKWGGGGGGGGTTSDTATNWCSSTLALGEMGDLEDEFDCFFTITSQDGEIHLFEALNTEDAQRIVAGIRCNAYRLSNLLIEGNSNALMNDFYDNTGEPTETRLSAPEAMNRLSHAFLDDL